MRRFLMALVALIAAGAFVPPAQSHFYAGCEKPKCKYHVVKPFRAEIRKIHLCESRDWFLDSTYDGGLQFSPSTWSKTGSDFDYAYMAPIIEQKYRAVIWASMIHWSWRSTAGWPNCG